jgi:hypothetical protein
VRRSDGDLLITLLCQGSSADPETTDDKMPPKESAPGNTSSLFHVPTHDRVRYRISKSTWGQMFEVKFQKLSWKEKRKEQSRARSPTHCPRPAPARLKSSSTTNKPSNRAKQQSLSQERRPSFPIQK